MGALHFHEPAAGWTGKALNRTSTLDVRRRAVSTTHLVSHAPPILRWVERASSSQPSRSALPAECRMSLCGCLHSMPTSLRIRSASVLSAVVNLCALSFKCHHALRRRHWRHPRPREREFILFLFFKFSFYHGFLEATLKLDLII